MRNRQITFISYYFHIYFILFSYFGSKMAARAGPGPGRRHFGLKIQNTWNKYKNNMKYMWFGNFAYYFYIYFMCCSYFLTYFFIFSWMGHLYSSPMPATYKAKDPESWTQGPGCQTQNPGSCCYSSGETQPDGYACEWSNICQRKKRILNARRMFRESSEITRATKRFSELHARLMKWPCALNVSKSSVRIDMKTQCTWPPQALIIMGSKKCL